MTFTDAATEVLRLVGRPLHYKEITDIAIEKNLLSHVGKSPEVTMGARLAATLKKDESENVLVRVKPGVFALREWDAKTIKAGLEKKGKKPTKGRAMDDEGEVAITHDPVDADEGEDLAVDVLETEADDDDDVLVPVVEAHVQRPAPSAPMAVAKSHAFFDEASAGPPGPDDVMRAEAVAGAGDIFDEEDDDDQPILGGAEETLDAAAGEAGDGRRRRRRRRRGRGGEGAVNGDRPAASAGLPSYTATPAVDGHRNGGGRSAPRDDAEGAHRPQLIELTGSDVAIDDLAGRDLSDAIAAILSTFDRNGGPVSLRQIAETAQRRGRVAGDAQLVQSLVAAAVRTDNQRRLANGQRPRFRLAGGRVALTDWLLGADLARLEQEAAAAIERYRDAARRTFARKLAELPGHAFIELSVLALERVGMRQLRAVRRPGIPGGEAHFSAVLTTAGDELRAAIVIRRDGREIGRERVAELRGSLHHYGPATLGWLLTSGQLMSGAREEAAIPGTPPMALFDGLAVARLCEDNDVAVIRARMPISIPDVDLLEALRAS
jgi:hypothetical protein